MGTAAVRQVLRFVLATAVLALALGGCGGVAPASTASTPTPLGSIDAPRASATAAPTVANTATLQPTVSPSASPPALQLPPPNAGFDYQLGGAYPPPAGVTIVSRDRTAKPSPGLYNICYVNGFQVQDSEKAWWLATHPDLMLRRAGKLVIDPDWNEVLLDVSKPAKRAQLAIIVGGWIRGCAADSFDAVEIDNLDTYSRSGGLITEDDAVAQIRLFSDASHAAGLAIAQKNSAEIVGRRAEMATDFAVAEECDRYTECDAYTGAYGDHVLVIEYRRVDFKAGCAGFPDLSIVLRDLDLVPPSTRGYVFARC